MNLSKYQNMHVGPSTRRGARFTVLTVLVAGVAGYFDVGAWLTAAAGALCTFAGVSMGVGAVVDNKHALFPPKLDEEE